VDVKAGLDAPHPPEVLFAWIADLGRYPSWLEIVTRADPETTVPADAGNPAWMVDLRARLGPIARSKRLRMVRTFSEPDRLVRFERAEVDGRHHSSWVLEASLAPTETGCHLTMTLHYAGGALAPLVQRLLNEEIERSGRRLLAQVAGGASA
jgi:hypothetical protein